MFLSFTFGWLIRPNMARRAFERDPVFSAALAIQNAAHLRRIAGLGGKAQAASGQLAAKAAAGGKAGGKAQAASGQLAAKAAAGGKAQAGRASREMNPGGVWRAKGKYAVCFNEKYIGTYSPLKAAYFVWNAAAREWNETHANPFEKYALFPSTPGDEAR